ncbi:hypothetical protein KR009_004322 [Drosophila setifemur]|nr:hypothetical protein KR009_004322 [Drosophila setifemur]
MPSESQNLDELDIEAYILNEYIPAKPLATNLEVCFGGSVQPAAESFAQLRCGDVLKFPFARADSQPMAVEITKSKILVEADKTTQTKRVVELTLETSTPIDFQPGDTIAVLPCNDGHLVDELLERLALTSEATTTCHVNLTLNCAKKSAKVPAHIPQSTNPREILSHCLALTAVPQKQFLSALATFTDNKRERSFLACLSSKQAAAHYNSLILERGLRFLDLLKLCTSCRPSLAFLAEHLPRLLPRPYSLSNSPLETGFQKIRIIYSLLDQNPGVTTSMLEAKVLQINKKKPIEAIIYFRLSNSFRYMEHDLCSNQILIAVGTGLSPFLGFLAHKELLIKEQPHREIGQTWLYAGAKTIQGILKREQLLVWQQSPVLQRLRMCQSRGESSSYVQQLLEDDAEELVAFLLRPDTVLYLCADGSKISQSIANGLRVCLQKVLHLNDEDALLRLNNLRTQGKYREDVWL